MLLDGGPITTIKRPLAKCAVASTSWRLVTLPFWLSVYTCRPGAGAWERPGRSDRTSDRGPGSHWDPTAGEQSPTNSTAASRLQPGTQLLLLDLTACSTMVITPTLHRKVRPLTAPLTWLSAPPLFVLSCKFEPTPVSPGGISDASAP